MEGPILGVAERQSTISTERLAAHAYSADASVHRPSLALWFHPSHIQAMRVTTTG
jgi:hypothetical protein